MKQRLRFLWDGSSEIGRKFQRSQLRSQLGKLGRQRGEALFNLGNNAWNNNIDLSSFPELREQLLKLDQRQSELAATSNKLQTERAALESKRTADPGTAGSGANGTLRGTNRSQTGPGVSDG